MNKLTFAHTLYKNSNRFIFPYVQVLNSTFKVQNYSTHEDKLKFWEKQAEEVHWFKKHDKILDDSNSPFYKWFQGGEINTCYNALDLNIERGLGNKVGLIYDSPVTNVAEKFTYSQILKKVEAVAAGLLKLGVTKGDRVIIYMPMVPEAVFGMLACARIGAIHCVVFGGFASDQLANRIDHAKPKVILAGSVGIEVNRTIPYKPLVDKAIEISKYKPETIVMLQRNELEANLTPDYVDWKDIMEDYTEKVDCVSLESNDPLYVLYTSGTTGAPKGVVRDNGGHTVALKYTWENVFGNRKDDVWWAASDIGWVVGHSYIAYGPLIAGSTGVLYEGKPVGTPDPGAFWRVIEQHKINTLFTAPTAFRSIKQQDPNGEYLKKYDISSLRAFYIAGERADTSTIQWAEKHLKVPVLDNWWQTEVGFPISAHQVDTKGTLKFPVKYGSAGKPAEYYKDQIEVKKTFHPDGEEELSQILIKLPLPPGTMSTLWENDDLYLEKYVTQYPGYYDSGDAGHIDEDGYLYVMSRTDDVINTAGHRISTGMIEEVLIADDDVAEAAVVSINDDLKTELPYGFVTLSAGTKTKKRDIEKRLIKNVREKIGPFAVFKRAIVVERLPKTRSGKILRRSLKQIVNSEELSIPATIDDPDILSEIQDIVKKSKK